jgi:hypothetical protein
LYNPFRFMFKNDENTPWSPPSPSSTQIFVCSNLNPNTLNCVPTPPAPPPPPTPLHIPRLSMIKHKNLYFHCVFCVFCVRKSKTLYFHCVFCVLRKKLDCFCTNATPRSPQTFPQTCQNTENTENTMKISVFQKPNTENTEHTMKIKVFRVFIL